MNYYRQLSVEGYLSFLTEESKMSVGIACLYQDSIEQAYVLAEELQKGENKESGDWLLLGCLLHDGKGRMCWIWLFVSVRRKGCIVKRRKNL